MNRDKIVAIDFDGTIVEDNWPTIGPLRKDVLEVVNKLKDAGSIIIIWTCRKGQDLKDAVEFLDSVNFPYDYINENAEWVKIEFNPVPKIYYDVLIDDRNLGGVPTWKEIEKMLLG